MFSSNILLNNRLYTFNTFFFFHPTDANKVEQVTANLLKLNIYSKIEIPVIKSLVFFSQIIKALCPDIYIL